MLYSQILSDFSTVGALLAGCAIAAVSGESFDALDDEHQSWHTIGTGIFVASGALALGTSLWVIFISSHLISLTRDSVERKNIIQARETLEASVRDVRGMLWIALAALLVSTTATAWLNLSATNGVLFSSVLAIVTWQAMLKKDDVTETFRARCGPKWAQADSLADVLKAFFAVFVKRPGASSSPQQPQGRGAEPGQREAEAEPTRTYDLLVEAESVEHRAG